MSVEARSLSLNVTQGHLFMSASNCFSRFLKSPNGCAAAKSVAVLAGSAAASGLLLAIMCLTTFAVPIIGSVVAVVAMATRILCSCKRVRRVAEFTLVIAGWMAAVALSVGFEAPRDPENPIFVFNLLNGIAIPLALGWALVVCGFTISEMYMDLHRRFLPKCEAAHEAGPVAAVDAAP